MGGSPAGCGNPRPGPARPAGVMRLCESGSVASAGYQGMVSLQPPPPRGAQPPGRDPDFRPDPRGRRSERASMGRGGPCPPGWNEAAARRHSNLRPPPCAAASARQVGWRQRAGRPSGRPKMDSRRTQPGPPQRPPLAWALTPRPGAGAAAAQKSSGPGCPARRRFTVIHPSSSPQSVPPLLPPLPPLPMPMPHADAAAAAAAARYDGVRGARRPRCRRGWLKAPTRAGCGECSCAAGPPP